MSAASRAKELLPQLASTDPSVRAAGYGAVSSLIVNGNSYDVAIADVVLQALLAARDPLALVPLATAAHGLFGVQAYPEALRCLDVLLEHRGTGPALSQKAAPWDACEEPFTRVRELALQGLFRYECLLALGRLDDAETSLPAVLTSASILPVPFKLSRSILEWGGPAEFVLRARIRAARALRLRAAGGDVAWRRKIPGKRAKVEDAPRLRAIARELVDRILPDLDRWLPKYAPFVPGTPPSLSLDEKRALQVFRADGYSEAGLLSRDDGDLARAARLLSTAHYIYSIFSFGLGGGVETEYAAAIRELAPTPALLSSS